MKVGDKKRSTKEEQEKKVEVELYGILIVGLVVGLIVIGLIGYLGERSDKPNAQIVIPTVTQTPIIKSPESTSIMPTTNTPTATIQATSITDDQKFASLLKESSKIIAVSSKGISDAAIREDYKSLELYGKYLKDDSQKYLNEMNKLEVSPSLKPIFDEYKLGLEKTNLAGKYTESGATNLNNDDLSLGSDYLNEAVVHIEHAVTFLESLKRS